MFPSLLLLLRLLSPPGTPPGDLTDWTAHPLIAHALGGIDGVDLTNSREAFEASYAKGFRVFETDLLISTDNRLVARHDWGIKLYRHLRQDKYFEQLPDPKYLSAKEFKELPIMDRYHGMEWSDMLDLMVQHPDIYYVLDTKFTDEATVKRQFGLLVDEAVRVDPALLDRIIPQLYNQKMLAVVDSVHSFSSYIYTLYQSKDTNQQVIDFVRANSRIKAVALAEGRVTKSFVLSLNLAGAKVYVHTVNDLAKYRQYQNDGVFGIYTDYLTYQDLLKGKKGSWTAEPPVDTE